MIQLARIDREDQALALMCGMRSLEGKTFTESDRAAIHEGLAIIRRAISQKVGTARGGRGAVSEAEYERAKMLVVMGAMQLWASGKLDEVEVDE